jgi:hypothetical protein
MRATQEIPYALAHKDTDVWNAHSVFVWDKSDQINVNRKHCSPILFRFRDRDQFPLDRDIQAPLPLFDEAHIKRRIGLLTTPLLDYGTFEAAERERVFNAFVKAYKRDLYVYSIIAEPELKSLDEYFCGHPWEDLWKK